MRALEGGDLAERRGRAGARQHCCRAGDLGQCIGAGLVGEQAASAIGGRQAKGHARATGHQSIVADRFADNAEIGVGHGIDDHMTHAVG